MYATFFYLCTCFYVCVLLRLRCVDGLNITYKYIHIYVCMYVSTFVLPIRVALTINSVGVWALEFDLKGKSLDADGWKCMYICMYEYLYACVCPRWCLCFRGLVQIYKYSAVWFFKSLLLQKIKNIYFIYKFSYHGGFVKIILEFFFFGIDGFLV